MFRPIRIRELCPFVYRPVREREGIFANMLNTLHGYG